MSDRRGANPYEDLARRTTSSGPSRGLVIGIAAVFVVVVLGVVAIFLTGNDGAGGNIDAVQEQGPVEVSGEPLQPMPRVDGFVVPVELDPAVGSTPPTLEGQDFEQGEVSIDPADGRAKVVAFLAHWCPHCQREVPVVVDYLANNPLPEGVDFYGISTLANKLQANFPPHKWLQRENFDFPALLDSREHEIQEAYGLFGTPFWVILDGNNRVVQRTSGELPVEMLDQIFRGAGALAEAGDLPIPDTAP